MGTFKLVESVNQKEKKWNKSPNFGCYMEMLKLFKLTPSPQQ